MQGDHVGKLGGIILIFWGPKATSVGLTRFKPVAVLAPTTSEVLLHHSYNDHPFTLPPSFPHTSKLHPVDGWTDATTHMH